jgi:transcriptional accessory protein Tex/SPT6
MNAFRRRSLVHLTLHIAHLAAERRDDILRCMQTTPSQDQLNRIEHRLQHLTQLVEHLLGKIEDDDRLFATLVRSAPFQQELKEDLEALHKDPSQLTDLYEAYSQHNTP